MKQKSVKNIFNYTDTYKKIEEWGKGINPSKKKWQFWRK